MDQSENECSICSERVVRKAGLSVLASPCCSAFLHRDCTQARALAAVEQEAHVRLQQLGEQQRELATVLAASRTAALRLEARSRHRWPIGMLLALLHVRWNRSRGMTAQLLCSG